MVTTFQDVMDRTSDWIGQNPSAGAVRDQRRAILDAYRELPFVRQWSYYWKHGRISLVASYSTGTISYTHSTRTVTLSGGTFPSWAALGTLIIGGTLYKVRTRSSGTALVLDTVLNPGADVAAGTSYLLVQDAYDLPADFRSMGELVESISSLGVVHVLPQEWLEYTRDLPGTGAPQLFTIVASPNTPGRLSVRFAPFPAAAQSFDYYYQAAPRPIVTGTYETGTASVSGTALTGNGTTWTSAMEGAIVRLSSNTTKAPTDFAGDYPFAHESRILTVTNATTIVLETAASSALSGVKYRISDPIDLEEGAMLEAFFRLVEVKLSLGRPLANREQAISLYEMAVRRAMEWDSRFGGERRIGASRTRWAKGTLRADDT